MNRMLLILCLFVIACSNNASKVETTTKDEHEQHHADKNKPTTDLQLNNGTRWKTDEATRKNVAQLAALLNDTSSREEKYRAQLTKQVQGKIDTLVQECKMKGPDHDALHVWLQQVLNKLKALKDEDTDYQTSYTALKNEVERFYTFFE